MCWVNECDDCKDGKVFQIKYGEMSSEVATTSCSLFIWKKDEDSKVVEDGSLEELEAYIINILPQFLQHCFAKMEQAASYQHQRENASLLLLPVDYTCQEQDEIQSSHWKQSQVSLFTAAFWHSETLHSQVIAFDNFAHYMETSETMPNVEVIEMTSKMINNTNKELGLDDLFKNAVTLQSIANVHCVTVNGNDINTWTITRATNTSPMPTRAKRRRS